MYKNLSDEDRNCMVSLIPTNERKPPRLIHFYSPPVLGSHRCFFFFLFVKIGPCGPKLSNRSPLEIQLGLYSNIIIGAWFCSTLSRAWARSHVQQRDLDKSRLHSSINVCGSNERFEMFCIECSLVKFCITLTD